MRTRKILKTLKNHWKKISVHVNIHMSKIICSPIKVGVHTYATYANCQTLLDQGSRGLHEGGGNCLKYVKRAWNQAWKFSKNNCFVTASFPSLIKDSDNNSFPQIHLQNANAFFEDLTGKHIYNLAHKLHFLHTDLPTLHKQACFSTTILPLLIYLECSPIQCVLKK